MPRRDFRTPPSLPVETQTRCITIPASQPWLGLVNAALLMLTEAWRYDQVEETDMTAEATAARAYQMYVEYLGECSMACCPLRINPFNGRLQQSDDGGLSWFDVEDGPWTESLYPAFSAMPQPRPEATEEERLCAAAATAAYVLANLYQQTGNTLLNVVAATDWEYAGALGAMLQGFLMMIGAAAVQPFVAVASLLGIVGVKQQYVDYPLDAADEERLTCILLENATLEPSDAVTFDFQAVWDAIDLDSPKNGLVRFLLTMIGPDALNYAGAIDAGITPDCLPCYDDSFCVTYDFTLDDYDFTTPTLLAPVAGTYGTYSPGVGWIRQARSSGSARLGATCIRKSFDETTITRFKVEYVHDVAEAGAWQGLQVTCRVSVEGDNPIDLYYPTLPSGDLDESGTWLTDYFQVWFNTNACNTCGSAGSATKTSTITRVTLWGHGPTPGGGVSCE